MVLEEEKSSSHIDEKIENQVNRASDQYWKRLRTLETEKERLPKIKTWEIDTIPDWEQYLIKEGENLRGLIKEVTHQDSSGVPMDYYLAHSLAEFAHLKNDIARKDCRRVRHHSDGQAIPVRVIPLWNNNHSSAD